VRVFKTGPDYIDPSILALASGQPVYQLDTWMIGVDESRRLLHAAAAEADVILVEGVMGLYDGQPSTADLAQVFDLPILVVIDAQAMAETFGAIALGLRHYRPDLKFAGICANRVAGQGHAEMLRKSLPAGLNWAGYLAYREGQEVQERHLGLLQALELSDLDARLDAWADALADRMTPELPLPTEFHSDLSPSLPRWLEGVRIGVARDAAFSFLYQANLDLLIDLGAQLRYFSPLTDPLLPEVDSIYLPGGYPELHLQDLSRNFGLRDGLREHVAADKPVLAECGGLLYLLDELTDLEGQSARLCGILPGRAQLQATLTAIGYQSAEFPAGQLRAHTFHHSILETSLQPRTFGQYRTGDRGEAVFQQGCVTAGYLHFYFPSNPEAVVALLRP
jgi:cobyrinic acid a,c-diamide synthase